MQHAEGVTRAVAQGQDHLAAENLLAAVEHHTFELAILDQHIADALLKTHFAAQRFNFFAHGGDHAGEAEGADMWLADVENFLWRAGFDELLQHLAPVMFGVFDLAVQLAVGEGAGTAFAELHVGLGVEHVLAPQAPGVLGALAHFGAAFQHDGLESGLGKDQCGENPARAKADYQRTLCEVLGCHADWFVGGIRGDADMPVIA